MEHSQGAVVLMITKIDWMSFSIPMDVSKMESEQDAPSQIVASLLDLHPGLPEWLHLETTFEARNGRAPYRTAWARVLSGLTIFAHPALPHALVEISGAGCDGLATDERLYDVLSVVQSRLTRIDIACDILTEERPKAWAEDRDGGRFKAHSYVNSESGETFYVGAKTSDRYCRVYRYNKPHERSAFLRVEYVIKAENSRLLAHAVLEQGLRPVVASLWDTFGWHRGRGELDATPGELEVYRPDRREGKTLFWLADTIAPLLARLQNEGVINVDEWVRANVYPKIKA